MLIVVLEVALVPVSIGVNILALAFPDAVDVVAVVLVAVGVLGVTFAGVVA